ncbi:chorismate synthase [Candidatus Gottesmanbacteria bacterium]|nr:chorismate synthase [Candidatus Gottesmanbacteria bacterium]MBI5452327.1 chorismate synthase [Candidatus Gottesmanbacteria bacterium]
MLRFLTAGESHGPAEIAILEGIPAGMSLSVDDIQPDLEKRRGGLGRGGRGKIETDEVEILAGVRFGKTLGSPIALMVKNLDSENWKVKMSIGAKPNHLEGGLTWHVNTITNPRPGHADLSGSLKYNFDDIRNVIERASARETVMRVAIGAICKKFLTEFDIAISSQIIQIGKVQLSKSFDSKKIEEVILDATKRKDTLGGVIEIIAQNVPPGLGSYVQWDKRLDGKLAGSLMSIPSVKAVEIGDGIANASYLGSEVHDEIYYDKKRKFYRQTNRAGGIEGGVSNGEDIICRIYLKPLSTLGKPLNTVDIKTKKKTEALIERSDICVVPRAGVIAESMIAFVLADAFLEKFGGDSLSETKRNFAAYLRGL